VISQNERGVRSTFKLQQSLVPFVSFCCAMHYSARVPLIYVPFRPDPYFDPPYFSDPYFG
jgi:hypothetical protein